MDPAAVGATAEERIAREITEALGVEVRSIERIDGGLGLRSFFRARTNGTPASLVVRVEAEEDPAGRPAGVPPEPALEPTRTFLAEHGIPVPLRFGGGDGSDFLEDLGSQSLTDAAVAAAPAERRALYEEACDLVVRFQRAGFDHAAPVPAFERRLDEALFRYKGELFARWSLPAALGRPARPAETEVVRDAFAAIAEIMRSAPQRLAHRDFQSANLFVRPRRRSGHRLAVIDFQGALLAPPEYDLVCLLHDSYVALREDEIAHHVQRIRPRLPDHPTAETFAKRFDLLTLTRKGKDHARFLYAATERGDERFLRYVPRTVHALQNAAIRVAIRDSRFTPFAELVDQLPGGAPATTEASCAE